MWGAIVKIVDRIIIIAVILGSLWWAGQSLHNYLLKHDPADLSGVFIFAGVGLFWIIDGCIELGEERKRNENNPT